MRDIMVSVCCMTYNHEKYIKDALDSFVAQKTNFEYEILIHDDASTDKTVEIIQQYEEKYPDLIKPIYQKENQYSKGISISKTYQFPRARGKYIAMCEGDDYWTDEYKLQKQFNALEQNLDCGICTCIVEHVSENGERLNVFQPSKKLMDKFTNQVVTSQEIFCRVLEKNIIPFQLSSFFMRKSIIDKYLEENPKFARTQFFGDVPLFLYFAAHGDAYVLPEVMSCYREFSIGSWTNTHFKVREKKINHYIEILNMLRAYDLYTNQEFENSIEKIIVKYEFLLLELQGKYKDLLRTRYRDNLKLRSFKEKVYIVLQALAQMLKAGRKEN